MNYNLKRGEYKNKLYTKNTTYTLHKSFLSSTLIIGH